MKWTVKQGDILNKKADVLICLANVSLNLSGGVGGEILRRYGDDMQQELHVYLAKRGLPCVTPGDASHRQQVGKGRVYSNHCGIRNANQGLRMP